MIESTTDNYLTEDLVQKYLVDIAYILEPHSELSDERTSFDATAHGKLLKNLVNGAEDVVSEGYIIVPGTISIRELVMKDASAKGEDDIKPAFARAVRSVLLHIGKHREVFYVYRQIIVLIAYRRVAEELGFDDQIERLNVCIAVLRKKFLKTTQLFVEMRNAIWDTQLKNHTISYQDYLDSPEWKRMREKKLSQESRCKMCGSTRNLQVHHAHYLHLGNEWDNDLTVLCDRCHSDHHGKVGLL